MTSPRAEHGTSFIEPVSETEPAADFLTQPQPAPGERADVANVDRADMTDRADMADRADVADRADADDRPGAANRLDLPDGRFTGDRDPTDAEVEEAAAVVETTLEASRNKADRATRGVLSALLALEALVVLLVPRAIAQTATGLDTTKTVILVALAVVLMLTAFLMRRRWAIGLGSVLQLAVLATGLLEWVMVVVALVFIGLWIWVLTMRHDWVRTPGGLRMLVS